MPARESRLVDIIKHIDTVCNFLNGNILATENQQSIINDVIDVKMGVLGIACLLELKWRYFLKESFISSLILSECF